jgi:signal peptidase I
MLFQNPWYYVRMDQTPRTAEPTEPAPRHKPDAAHDAPTAPHHRPATRPSRSTTHRWRSVAANVGVLLLAPVIALLLTAFVFQSYQVDGKSMQNTLQDADRLIVLKTPRTWARITGHQYIPGRGDIIIVNQQNLTACGQSNGTQIVKRVIGLPGERVVYKNGGYMVYNAAHPHGFDPDTTLPYGQEHTALLNDPGAGSIDVRLGSHQLFISGDHRADSCDSRYFGPIESNQIIGKVMARVYPITDAKKF